jgi:hypothetical protein
MSLPTVNDVGAVETVLTNMLVGYMQADKRFVADRLFSGVPVNKDSGTYYLFTKKYWFLNQMKYRPAGGNYPLADFGVETSTFTTMQKALAYRIADEVRANSQVPMDLETAAVRWLAQQILLAKEISFSTDFMKTSVWGTDDDNSATDWDDFSSGDPVSNIQTACRTISNNSGYDANTMVVGYIVHNALVNHPDMIDRIKYTQTAGITQMEGAVSSVLGIPNYVVAKATYSNTNESASFSATAIIDDDALICYVSPNPGLFEASAGYTFHWAPGGGLGSILPVYRDAMNDADVLKAKMQWDQVVVANDLGYFFADIV